MGSSSLSWRIGCLIDVRGPSCLLARLVSPLKGPHFCVNEFQSIYLKPPPIEQSYYILTARSAGAQRVQAILKGTSNLHANKFWVGIYRHSQ